MRDRVARIVGLPAVIATRSVLDRYGAAGGSLLAGGLANAALFAIVPAVILAAGVIGLVYADPADRAAVVNTIVGVLPPMRELIDTVLLDAAQDAGSISILGGVALIWGTSRFVVAFDAAIARVMGGQRQRGVLVQNLVALGAVVLMVAAIPLTAVLSGVLAFLEVGQSLGVLSAVGGILSIVLVALPVASTVGAMILVYRFVPVPRPSWRAAMIPGVVVGLALSVVARAFAFLAPRLLGSAALLGTLVAVFAALAWLALSFQAILLGAAWVRERASRQVPAGATQLDA